MGRAKRKQVPPTVATSRVEREAPLDDRALKAILAVYGDGNGNGSPLIGLRYAVIAGIALWTIIGGIVILLI